MFSSFFFLFFPTPGQGPRHLSARVGMFRGCGRPTRLLYCPSPGHEDRLHTQVRAVDFCFAARFVTVAFLDESFFCAADTAEFCRRTAWPSPTWWRRCRSRARCSTSSASSRRSTRGWSSSRSAAATPCARVDLAGGLPGELSPPLPAPSPLLQS